MLDQPQRMARDSAPELSRGFSVLAILSEVGLLKVTLCISSQSLEKSKLSSQDLMGK